MANRGTCCLASGGETVCISSFGGIKHKLLAFNGWLNILLGECMEKETGKISISRRIAALACATKALEEKLGEMGGSIAHNRLTYKACKAFVQENESSLKNDFYFTFSARFDPAALCEYADRANAQAQGSV